MATNIKFEDSTSPCSSEEQNSNSVLNSFANDGSFMEIYKQQLKQKEDACSKTKETLSRVESDTDKRKSTNLLLQGKRKIPVGRLAGGTSKQFDAKKKKQEKSKKKEVDNPDEKSSAWKAYMEEVKKYKEMSCTDDTEQNRPLVK